MTFMTRTIVVDDDDPTIEEDWRIFFLLWGHLIEFPISFPFRQGATVWSNFGALHLVMSKLGSGFEKAGFGF